MDRSPLDGWEPLPLRRGTGGRLAEGAVELGGQGVVLAGPGIALPRARQGDPARRSGAADHPALVLPQAAKVEPEDEGGIGTKVLLDLLQGKHRAGRNRSSEAA